MNVTIFCAGHTVGSKDSRSSGCAILCLAAADDGRVLFRKMHFALGDATLNLARLQAVRLALMAVRPFAYAGRVDVYTDGYYVAELAVKNGADYRAAPKTNVAEVQSMRSYYDRFTNLSLVLYKAGELADMRLPSGELAAGIAESCLALARYAAESQLDSDSGTKEFSNVAAIGF